MAVLTDVEKRKQYDLYGNDEERVSRSRTHNYSRGFEAEVSPDELFNMFFGTSFGSNVYVRRGGRWQRQAADSQQEHHRQREVVYRVFLVNLVLKATWFYRLITAVGIYQLSYSFCRF